MRVGIISSFVFSFLLSFNGYPRAYFLVGQENTLPLTMFGAMNFGASPTVYALSGAILVISFGLAGILLVVRQRGPSAHPHTINLLNLTHTTASEPLAHRP